MEYRTINWDREQLYEAIWKRPAVQLAKEYGISDVALAKICKKLDVPKPGLGYWRRKEMGYKVNRPPLPVTKKNAVAVTHIALHPAKEAEQIPDEFKSSLNPARAVPTRHQTVKQTALAFEKGSLDTYGRLNPSDWRLPRFDFRLTKSTLHRALGFMDELVKLLEANGIDTKIPNDERRFIQFDVEGEQIRVSLREPVRRRKRDLTTEERRDHERYPSLYPQTFRWAYDPTGRLSFEIDDYSDARRKWTDTKNKKVEAHTHEIVYALRAAAAYEKRMRMEQQAERERQWIEQKRRMKQQERIDRLKRNVANWEEAERIRAYLGAVREKAKEKGRELNEDNSMSRFLAWAECYAASLDSSGSGASPDWLEDS